VTTSSRSDFDELDKVVEELKRKERVDELADPHAPDLLRVDEPRLLQDAAGREGHPK
jgi:hypothetical protein